MQMKEIAILVGALILSGALSACSFGGGDETTVQTRSTTTGQELQDIKAAYDKGIITERQYEEQKARLLSGR